MKTKDKKNFSLKFEVWLPLLYLIAGGLWILFSDRLLLNLANGNLETLAKLQTLKGWFYVLTTAILLYILLWNNNRRRKEYIRLIDTARKNLEKANKMKTNFLANLSHELRTPMNAINGFTDLIRQYVANPEESQQYLVIIRENTLKLLRIIENIVDMSKIQINQLELKVHTFSVDELIDTLKHHTENIVSGDRLMNFVKFPGEQVFLSSDFNRLFQVCEILVMNSLSNPGKGTLMMSFQPVNDKYSIDIFWKKSFDENMHPSETENQGFILPESIGWEIASGIIKLLQGTITVYTLTDKTYRFVLVIPQKIQEI
jgi:signal transduction histidine kinase